MKRLDEIGARLKAATPGPWHTSGIYDPSNRERAGMDVYGPTPAGAQSGECITRRGKLMLGLRIPNAELVANTPADLGYLLRLVRMVADAPCRTGGMKCVQAGESVTDYCWPCWIRYQIEKESAT